MIKKPPIISEPQGLWERFLWRFWRQRHIHEHYVQVIYRDRRFERVAGPGYFRLRRGESTGEPIYLGLRFTKLEFPNLATRELVPVTIKTSVSYRFDPRLLRATRTEEREAARELASYLINLPEVAFQSILEGAILPLLRDQVAATTVAEVQGGLVLKQLENELKTVLVSGEPLRYLGITIQNLQIEERHVPQSIQERYVESAGTKIVRDDVQNEDAAELFAASILKYMEKMYSTHGTHYVSTSEMLTFLKPLMEQLIPPTRIVESEPVRISTPTIPPIDMPTGNVSTLGTSSAPSDTVSYSSLPSTQTFAPSNVPSPLREEPDQESYGD